MDSIKDLQRINSFSQMNELFSSEEIDTRVNWAGQRLVCSCDETVAFSDIAKKISSLIFKIEKSNNKDKFKEGRELAICLQNLKNQVDFQYSQRNLLWKLLESIIGIFHSLFSTDQLDNDEINNILAEFCLLSHGLEKNVKLATPLLNFYRKFSPNIDGKTLDEIWNYSDDQCESDHRFIQWIFPNQKPSRFNVRAPLLSLQEIQAFQNDTQLQQNLLRSLDKMLSFWGLKREDDAICVESEKKLHRWFVAGNHNLLRITRVLISLKTLGLKPQAKQLLDLLRHLVEDHKTTSLQSTLKNHWETAV